MNVTKEQCQKTHDESITAKKNKKEENYNENENLDFHWTAGKKIRQKDDKTIKIVHEETLLRK